MIKWIVSLYDSWNSIPEPIRKAIQGAIVSYQFSLQNILVALYAGYTVLADTTHQPVTFAGYLLFVKMTWFATAMGVFSASYRARQGYKDATAAADAFTIPDGTLAGQRVILVKQTPPQQAPELAGSKT